MDPDPDASAQVAFCRRGRRSLADCYESSARSAFRCSITFAKFLLNPSTSRIRKPPSQARMAQVEDQAAVSLNRPLAPRAAGADPKQPGSERAFCAR
jgi:hypothetical protein